MSDRSRRLDPLLRPRSVAVVGASPNPSFVSAIFRNLLRYGFVGPVAAVNPRYSTIADAPCYASILDVPFDLDLVVVGIAWRFVPDLLAECEQKGVKALVVITAGYAEAGGDGIARQQALHDWAARTGTPVGGPNCLGVMHAPTGMVALPNNFGDLVSGEVGLVLQSGMMAPSVVTPLFARHIGVSFAVTSGNEVDVDLAEYIRYFVQDPDTHVIGCFAEQIKRPAEFIDACQVAADAQKPIVMLKIGRSAASQRSALAHTGSLVGSDGVIDAVLRTYGVTRVNSVDEMFEALAIFHTRRLPRGDGVAAVSVSGGAAGLLSDLALDCGVQFAELTPETRDGLRAVVPDFGSVGNPLDVTGQGVFQPDLLQRSLDLLASDPGVDSILYARSIASRFDAATPAYQAIEAAQRAHPDIPILALALAGGHFFPSANPDIPMRQPADQLDGVPFLQGAEYGLRSLGALNRYADFLRARRRRQATHPPAAASGSQATACAIVAAAHGTRLSAREGSAVLAAYGIATPAEILATTREEALAAADRIGYPVAAKVDAPSLAHKARAGGVALGLRDASAVAEAFDRVLAAAADAEGVLIQQMVDGRAEVIVGMSHDAQFGPVVACGLGGVLVEVLQDVQLLLPPITEVDARAALQRLRGAAMLQGLDVAALVSVLINFGQLCVDLGARVKAIDLNPVLLTRDGAVAVDSLFEL